MIMQPILEIYAALFWFPRRIDILSTLHSVSFDAANHNLRRSKVDYATLRGRQVNKASFSGIGCTIILFGLHYAEMKWARLYRAHWNEIF